MYNLQDITYFYSFIWKMSKYIVTRRGIVKYTAKRQFAANGSPTLNGL